MTQVELKKKIAGILKEAMKPIEYGGDIEHAPEVHYPTEDEIADSLIGAVIGDVLGHRVFVSKDGKEIKQLYNDKEVEQIVKERNMYKHRAAVAEKALDKAVELFYKYRAEVDTLSCSSCPMFDYGIFDKCKRRGLYQHCYKRWREELIRQAEKELAEEEENEH